MAYDPLDLGSAPNAGDGDPLRTAGGRINAMFSELYSRDRWGAPAASAFSTLVGTNSENPSAADTDRGLLLGFGSSPAAGDNVRQALKSKPSGTDYSIIARMRATHLLHNYNFHGLAFRESSSGKVVVFAKGNQDGASLGGIGLKVIQYTNPTTFSSLRFSGLIPANIEWLRADFVSGNLTNFYVSDSGHASDWVQVLSESQSGFLTIDQVGFVVYYNRNAGVMPVVSTPQLFARVMYYADPDITPPAVA